MPPIGRSLFLAAALLVPALGFAQATDPHGVARDPMQHFFSPSLGDLKAELAEARRAGKLAAFVMYTRDDCPYCERMKKKVLSKADVQAFYRKHFAVLAVDTRGDVPITDFAGKQTTEKAFAGAQGVKYTPTAVFYGFDGAPLVRIDGEIRSVEDFMLLGEFVAGGAYRSMKFADFKQQNSGARLR